MFKKFGEFDSAAELNRAAAGQKKEGDIEALVALAEENGIDREDAEDYADDVVDTLTTTLMAAFGKVEIECREIRQQEIITDWIEYIKSQCVEQEEMAAAVRKKGKRVKLCIAALLKEASKNRYQLDKEICKAAGVPENVQMGMPGSARAKQIIVEYYMS